MLSRTTVELSTSIPIAIDKPPKDITLSVISFIYIRANVAITDVGIETAITADVLQLLRNMKSTITAIAADWKTVVKTLLTESFIY